MPRLLVFVFADFFVSHFNALYEFGISLNGILFELQKSSE